MNKAYVLIKINPRFEVAALMTLENMPEIIKKVVPVENESWNFHLEVEDDEPINEMILDCTLCSVIGVEKVEILLLKTSMSVAHAA